MEFEKSNEMIDILKSDNQSQTPAKTSFQTPVKEGSIPVLPSKRAKTSDCNDELSDRKYCKRRTKKMKRSPKEQHKNAYVDTAELETVLEGIDNEEIDNVLEETAQKNKLTATNVRSILKYIVINEHVLTMVRNTMKEEGDLEEAVFEPKLTRSKVKELREKQRPLPWPVSTPAKQTNPETKALLEGEFSDESSSDEDYKPNEEECPSEEDIAPSSPKSGDLDSSICEKTSVLDTKLEEDPDEDIGLVIEIPEQEPENASTDYEVDKIALRTRSKLPLNDTPLEAIEASFVAPDITVDMYDTQCNDEEWLNFLRELSQPLDAITAVEKPDEEPDDPEEDPTYDALEDEDIPDELDYRFDNSMKISRKELDDIIAESYEYDEAFFNDFDEDEEEAEVSIRVETPISEVKNADIDRTEWWMTSAERLQLEHQMRQYVQCLTQLYLLSFGIPEQHFINESSKLFLNEIKMFAACGSAVNGRSAFYAHNLDGALAIVDEYENHRNSFHLRTNIASSKFCSGISSAQVKKTIYSSKVFIYPDLLPTRGFCKSVESRKSFFIPAEDNLIALGLEEFSFAESPVTYIRLLLVPTKTEQQINIRIKNSKCARMPLENPIKYYFVHKKAPPIPRTIEFFDPDQIKAPRNHPIDILPNWMRQLRWSESSSEPYFIKTVSAKRLPHRRKLRKLLPRTFPSTNTCSYHLKQMSPVIKKHNQKIYTSLSADHPANVYRTAHLTKKLFDRCTVKNKNFPSSVDNNHPCEDVSESLSKENFTGHSLKVRDRTPIVKTEISDTSEFDNSNATDCDANIDLETACRNEHDRANGIQNENVLDDSNLVNLSGKNTSNNNILLQKNSDSPFVILQLNDSQKEKKEALFVNSYLSRVTEALKEDGDTCKKFLKVLCMHQHSAQTPIKLYLEIKEILKDYPALADDFIAFLTPEQAKECGKYEEYVTLSKIRSFIHKIEVHFRYQPQHLLEILRILSQFRQQCSITSAEVLNVLQPMLKNQRNLMDELVNFLDEIQPSGKGKTDCEDTVTCKKNNCISNLSESEESEPSVMEGSCGDDCSSEFQADCLNVNRQCADHRNQVHESERITVQSPITNKHSSSAEEKIVKENSIKMSADDGDHIASSKNCLSSISDVCTERENTSLTSDEPDTESISLNSSFSKTVSSIHKNENCENFKADISKDVHKPPPVSDGEVKWTREEDKLILQNCQKFGITMKSFQTTSAVLKSRSAEEVQERFVQIMNLLSKELNI